MKDLSKYILTIFYLFIGFFTINCSINMSQTSPELSDEGKACYGFIAKVGKNIGNKFNMSLCSVGGGAKDGIWLMSLDFQRYGSLLKEEDARELIINCLHDFLQVANNDEKLRPFLKNYPFTVENIDMSIFNYMPDKQDTYHPYIRVVSANI